MMKPIHTTDAMSVREFLAFTETRPDDEKWELIDGEAILNASPNKLHQRIARNLMFELETAQRALEAAWEVIPGVTVPVSDDDAPVPDILIRPHDYSGDNVCDDMIVAFEILSASTWRRDLGRKRRGYPLLPSLQRYVVVAQEETRVFSFCRSEEWREQKIEGPEAVLVISELRLALPFLKIYWSTGLV